MWSDSNGVYSACLTQALFTYLFVYLFYLVEAAELSMLGADSSECLKISMFSLHFLLRGGVGWPLLTNRN